MSPLSRRRRAPLRRAVTSLCALAAVACVSAPIAQAAPGDPDLRVSAPSSSTADWFGYFDDHSTVGDNHNGWAHGAGDPKWSSGTEPFAIRFQSAVQAAGAGLRVCGYEQTTDTNVANQWMRAYQVPSGQACPGTAPASGQVGWLRYVVANHFHQNRWQLLDFERFALVSAGGVPVTPPMPAAVTGPGAANDPLKHSVYDPSCDESLFFALVPGSNPAYEQLHCWTPAGTIPALPALPATNSDPAFNGQGGVFWDDRWGSCISAVTDGLPADACGKGLQNATTRQMDIGAGQTKGIEVTSLSEPSEQIIALDELRDVPVLASNPGRYYIVSWVNPYGSLRESDTTNNIACTAVDIASVDPAVNDGKALRVTRSANQPTTCPWQAPAGGQPPVQVPTVPTQPAVTQTGSETKTLVTPKPGGNAKKLPTMRATAGLGYAKTAVRKALKYKATPKGMTTACKVTSATSSACTVSWKSGRTSYKGSVALSYALKGSQGSWRYAVDVTKKRDGKASKIKRSTTTGGSVALVS
jgi:hypothetical protein